MYSGIADTSITEINQELMSNIIIFGFFSGFVLAAMVFLYSLMPDAPPWKPILSLTGEKGAEETSDGSSPAAESSPPDAVAPAEGVEQEAE